MYAPTSQSHDTLGFAWVTGEAFNYTNWSPNGAPDSTGEFYMEMYNIGPPFYPNETPGVWNDIGNNGQGFLFGNGFIVEFDTSAVPEPASLTLLAIGALGLLSFARQRSGNGEKGTK